MLGLSEMSAGSDSWDVVFGTTRVVFGRNAVDSLGELVLDLGAKSVLIVSDPKLLSAGHVDRAATVLRAASIDVAIFTGIEENPTTANIRAGVEFARQHDVRCIVGLGGGSAMDGAKGINFLLTNGGEMKDYWGHGKATQPMLPSIGVPTTAGTGSEAQSYTLIADEETGAKMACGDRKAIFRTVVLDPCLCASRADAVAAATVIDAITHAVESYVSTVANAPSRLFGPRPGGCSIRCAFLRCRARSAGQPRSPGAT